MKYLIALTSILLFACSEKAETPAGASPKTATTAAPTVSETRDSVQSKAVASYSERTDNPLNEWYFRVRIFETPSTFKYLIRLQFEEITGEDTLRLPNLGTMPEPVIRKGPDKYSCIIGFKDQDGAFREYKKVYVKNNSLKITALRHYAVTTR